MLAAASAQAEAQLDAKLILGLSCSCVGTDVGDGVIVVAVLTWRHRLCDKIDRVIDIAKETRVVGVTVGATAFTLRSKM